MPTTPRTLQRNVTISTLPTNAKHAYANTLAQAIHKHHGIPNCTPAIPQGETPSFTIVGAHMHTKPQALDTHHPAQPKYGIPHATIDIGGYEYRQAIASLPNDQYLMWFKWLQTSNAPSLIRVEDTRILLDDANWNYAAKAATWILGFAWVDIYT